MTSFDVVEALRKKALASLYGEYKKRGTRKYDQFELHAYHFFDFCARRVILALEYGMHLDAQKKFPPQTLLTFRIGEKIEEIAKEILQGEEAPILKARIGPKIRVRGHPDFLVTVNGYKMVVECKSIKKEDFVGLTEPIHSHKYQLMYYLWLGKRLNAPYYHNAGIVLYIPKQQTSDLFKAFVVKYNDNIAEEYEGHVKAIKKGLKGQLPDRTCNNFGSARRRDCPVRHLCFKDEEISWLERSAD